MSQAASDKLIELVKRSDLVPAKKLDAFLGKLASSELGVPEDGQEVADMLVEDGLLTKWQADKLVAGKHRGFRLGKYKLLSAIGKGGMSHVYLAEHTLMERRVAIKVLPRQRVKDKSYLQRFQLEARAAARLDDPNIVRVYDIDNEGETHYIVMEYVEGRDLHQTVGQDGPLPYNTAVRYVAQVATGLQHAHEMGLVHRDIKPANCLVDKAGVVKLLDMGLAKLSDDETSLTLAHDENVLGTADYLAPEQALNSHTADARADIYSLGCTLYFLVAGRPPFPEGTISERLLKHQVEEPDSLLKTRPDCPLSLENLCRRMMAKKPEDRPQTAGEVADLLNDWLSDRGESSATPHRPGKPPAEQPGSGVGSGILSRYTAAVPGTGSSKAGSGDASANDTAKLYASHAVDTEEDMALAPLDEDDETRRDKLAKKAAASSGVLSDGTGSGSKLDGSRGSGSGSDKSKPGSQLTSEEASLSSVGNPVKPMSIFDEEYTAEEEGGDVAPLPSGAHSSGYNPLHPPGYKNPYSKTPAWVYVTAGLFALGVLIAILVAMN